MADFGDCVTLMMMGKEAIQKLCRRLLEERRLTLNTITAEIQEADLLKPSGTEELSVLDILELILAHDAELASEEAPSDKEPMVGLFLHPLYFIRLAWEKRGKLLQELDSLTDEDLDAPFADSGLTVREAVERVISSESEYLRPALERYIESRGN